MDQIPAVAGKVAEGFFWEKLAGHNLNSAQFDICPCNERILNFGEHVRVRHKKVRRTRA